MLEIFLSVQYCYEYLIAQIPIVLLLYSHIPTGLVALLFGGFVFLRARTQASLMLFLCCLSFALWCFFDLITWFAFLGSAEVMFFWSLLDLVGILIFIFGYAFLYSFLKKKDLPNWQKVAAVILTLPTAIFTFLGSTLPIYDANSCASIENFWLAKIPYVVEAIIILATLALTFSERKKATTKESRRRVLLAGAGVSTLLIFFYSATLLVNLLAEGDASLYVYNYEIYGLFGMPIFLIYLGNLIVRYKAFDLRTFGVQMLSLALVAGIASQFAFLESNVTRILAGITLVMTGIVSLLLGRSVKREIGLRKQLEVMNNQQIQTMRFITHEVKGYLTDSSGAFDALLTNSFGPINDETRTMVQEALNKDQKAIGEIKEFLRISDFKTGKVAYQMAPFDIQEALSTALPMLDDNAQKKNLHIITNIAPGNYMIHGDQDQITNHVISNLINNATHYTPAGSITISLSRKGDRILFSVQDTGVGLSEEDKAVLFTEGGRGTESRNVNPHSTGYGLFIAKKIVEAHGGRIWAESEGRDKGSTFFVELPALN